MSALLSISSKSFLSLQCHIWNNMVVINYCWDWGAPIYHQVSQMGSDSMFWIAASPDPWYECRYLDFLFQQRAKAALDHSVESRRASQKLGFFYISLLLHSFYFHLFHTQKKKGRLKELLKQLIFRRRKVILKIVLYSCMIEFMLILRKFNKVLNDFKTEDQFVSLTQKGE